MFDAAAQAAASGAQSGSEEYDTPEQGSTGRSSQARQGTEPQLPVRDALLGFHNIPQDIVNSGQVAFAFRFQPGEHSRFETHAHGHLRPNVTQSHHLSQLLIRQMGNIFEVDIRIVACCLPGGVAPKRLPFLLTPFPVPDIVGCRSFQLCGLR